MWDVAKIPQQPGPSLYADYSKRPSEQDEEEPAGIYGCPDAPSLVHAEKETVFENWYQMIGSLSYYYDWESGEVKVILELY